MHLVNVGQGENLDLTFSSEFKSKNDCIDFPIISILRFLQLVINEYYSSILIGFYKI